MYAKNIRPNAKRDTRIALKFGSEALDENVPAKRTDFSSYSYFENSRFFNYQQYLIKNYPESL